LDGLTTDAGRACVDWGVDEHAAASPNIVIVKAKLRIMRAGWAIIAIALTERVIPPYGMEP
jgi:hypothetical protein